MSIMASWGATDGERYISTQSKKTDSVCYFSLQLLLVLLRVVVEVRKLQNFVCHPRLNRCSCAAWMSLLGSWGGKERGTEDDLSLSKISAMGATEQSRVFFEALRGCFLSILLSPSPSDGDLPSIRMILQSNRSLLHEKLFGYEGHDIYGTVPNVSFVLFSLPMDS